MGNRRIAIVISSLCRGGAERAASDMSLHWPKDWNIDLIINCKDEIEYPYRGNIIDLGLKPKKNKLDILYQVKVFFIRIKNLKKLKREQNYDACISFMDSANIANILTGKRYCKVIGTVHTNIKAKDQFQYKYLISPLVKLFYNKADKIVAVSEEVSDDLVQFFKLKREKVLTIHNGHDIDRIKSLAVKELCKEEKLWFKDSDNVIATMGRLETPKAQWHLIRAMKTVKEKIGDARLLILGEGQYRERLSLLIKEMNLEDNVILCGMRENPFRVISRCKAFVMSSIYEGFPQVLPEAMCCGLPCIATDFRTGVREIMDPSKKIEEKIENITYADYGIISPLCDGKIRDGSTALTNEEKMLADAICLILENEGLRKKYGSLGIKRSELLSIKSCIDRYWDLVNDK